MVYFQGGRASRTAISPDERQRVRSRAARFGHYVGGFSGSLTSRSARKGVVVGRSADGQEGRRGRQTKSSKSRTTATSACCISYAWGSKTSQEEAQLLTSLKALRKVGKLEKNIQPSRRRIHPHVGKRILGAHKVRRCPAIRSRMSNNLRELAIGQKP